MGTTFFTVRFDFVWNIFHFSKATLVCQTMSIKCNYDESRTMIYDI